MDPKVIESWNKALDEFRLAEERIRSNEEPKVIIKSITSSVVYAFTAISQMKCGEMDLAISDLMDFGGEIKNKSVSDALRSAKKALKRLHDLTPRDYHLPEP